MSEIDISTWNPDPALNESIGGIPLNESAPIQQTWQALQMLMAAAGKNGLQLVPFRGASSQEAGSQGLVPAPSAGDQDKVLKGDGTWDALSASDIPNIDASKIASGTIDLARLPAGALERLVTVADQTARFALTTASVQLGDTVKQLDTGIMYIVVDTSKLGQAAGYVEYTAGSAASVPWSGVADKPSTFPPSSHTHGSITNDGKLGTASRVVVTDGDKKIAISDVTATELGYLSGVTGAVQTQISGKVSKSGDTMNGDLTISKASPHLITKNTSITRGAVPSSNVTVTEILGRDSAEKLTWALYHTYATDRTHRIRLLCYNGLTTDTQYAEIGVGYDSDGNPYTNAPTPSSATDSTTKIATTRWVRTATGNFACNAASASAVPWSGVTNKPSTFPPSSHAHGSLTSDGKLGTASRAVQTDANGDLAVSGVTSTELGCLSGVTSNVQTQLDAKAGTAAATQSAAGLMSAADKTKLDGLPTVSEMGAGYIRYSNGLQMCFETVEIKTGTATSSLDSSGNVYYGTKTVTFPKAFSSAPVVTLGGHDGGTGFYNATTNSVSATQVEIEVYGRNSNVTCTPGYFAIGTWSQS